MPAFADRQAQPTSSPKAPLEKDVRQTREGTIRAEASWQSAVMQWRLTQTRVFVGLRPIIVLVLPRQYQVPVGEVWP
jgi:hypothetical protein